MDARQHGCSKDKRPLLSNSERPGREARTRRFGTVLGKHGMVEVFQINSKLIYQRPADGPTLWQHPAGIYMAVPNIGEERLFSSLAAARDYHNRRGRRY
jgi:hypothetical protein